MHPKLHQIAGQNPNINFVRVEYNEELGKALERYEGHAEYIEYNSEYRLPEEIQELLDDGDVTARKVARVEMSREQLEGAFTTEEGRGEN